MIKNLGWLSRNCLRSYPLQEDVSKTSLNTGWVLDDRILADVFVTAPDVDHGVYLSAVTITSRIMSVTFASTKDGRTLGTASAVYGVDLPMTQKPIVPLEPGVAGAVTFGTALSEEFFENPGLVTGMHLFADSARLEVRSYLSTGPFPVQGLSVLGRPSMSGSVEIVHNDRIGISRTDASEDGDPVTYFTLSLTEPTAFLSPCETPTSPCQCQQLPIHDINGVVGDEDGRVFIEVVDEKGVVTPLGGNALNFRLLRDGKTLCEKPVMPDDYGRLSGGTGDYSKDEKPDTDYKNPADTTFPEPVV